MVRKDKNIMVKDKLEDENKRENEYKWIDW